jgi:hypothetical protein
MKRFSLSTHRGCPHSAVALNEVFQLTNLTLTDLIYVTLSRRRIAGAVAPGHPKWMAENWKSTRSLGD